MEDEYEDVLQTAIEEGTGLYQMDESDYVCYAGYFSESHKLAEISPEEATEIKKKFSDVGWTYEVSDGYLRMFRDEEPQD